MIGMRTHYRLAQVLCQWTFEVPFGGRVFGKDNVPRTGPVLLLSNHQSFLDPVLVALPLPRECCFMARDTLFKQPQFTALIRNLGAFPIKRGTADVAAIKESLRRLKNGEALVAFPEGTRTQDGSVGAMQPGPILLARRTRAPIVPVAILGAYEALPRTSKTPQLHPLIVSYGEPVSVEDVAARSDEEAMELVRNRIVAMHTHFTRHANMGGEGLD